ncbi:MAG TPA: organomercurial lyase [Candidatus Baltobacteraceae bacterium]|nr:organomercurial lyase [Candidatus Baltobacteraceae bacterium]
MTAEAWQVRAAIYGAFLREGCAPAVERIAQEVGGDARSVLALMRQLHAQHHIVLCEDGELIAAHPFSNVPTIFDVSFAEVRTRGFCIWDALGVAAMSGKDTVIETVCAFCLHHIRLEVVRGKLLSEEDYVAQFLIPAERMWDDIRFTCSTQLAFCDEAHAKRWRERYHREPGSILTMAKTWQLAHAWYAEDRRDPQWRRRSVPEMNAIFRRLELPQPFWHVTGD